jgi:hypothetical protein
MKYMVLISGSNEAWSGMNEAEQQALYGRIASWWDERVAAGEILEGHQLQGVETATTIRRGPDGNVRVTDGPFIEGKEVVGGYAVIDVPDLDAAIRLASSWPAPDTLEIRPIVVR